MTYTEKEYIIFADESDRKGPRFGNFYGAAMVGATQYERITEKLNSLKDKLGFNGEIKWEKVSEAYKYEYQAFVVAAFEEIRHEHLRIRIMFQASQEKRRDLSPTQFDEEFGILYYQFLKHAFAFNHLPTHDGPVNLRFYLDHLPETKEKRQKLKAFLAALSLTTRWKKNNLTLLPENIVEVDSKEHVIIQVVDVILGAMCFRLNNKHKLKSPETGKRGKRTKAKEALYNFIRTRIQEIRPGFNIGVSTSGVESDRWHMPYRHWRFQSNK